MIDIADKTCGCCGAALHAIDEDRSGVRVPAQLRVQVIRSPRYGCRPAAKAPSCRRLRRND